MPTITGKEATQLILRWFHFIAGITWVGLLYFFNLVNVPFMKQVDAGMKAKDLSEPDLARSELVPLERSGHGFHRILVLGAVLRRVRMRKRQGGSAGATIGFFLLLWIAVWFVLFLVIKKMTPSGYMLGVITAVLVYAAGWMFVHYTPVGGDDIHVLSIGVGGGFGIVMLFNVWGIIWPNNKKIIRGTLAGTPPANAATMARQAFLASRTNFFLVGPAAVLHGGQFALLEHGDLREVTRIYPNMSTCTIIRTPLPSFTCLPLEVRTPFSSCRS